MHKNKTAENSMKKRNNGNKNFGERGSVVVEASLSLSFFMFFIVTLLTLINICTAQAKVAVALNESAKEVSQYGYLYSLTGLNETQKEQYAAGDANRADIDECLDAATQAKEALVTIADLGSDVPSGEDAWDAYEQAVDAGENVVDTATAVYENIKSDPHTYFIGLMKVCGNEMEEGIKGKVAGAFAKGLMYKHLYAEAGQSPDQYLKHLGVVGGMSGLNLDSSSVYTNGSDDITFICNYNIRVIRLLNVDINYNINQVAKTMAWSGNSLVRETPSEDEDSGGAEVSGGSAGDTETPDDSTEDPVISDEETSDEENSDEESSEEETPEEDPEETPEEEPDYAAIRQKMIDKYGEGAIQDIEDAYDTSKWDEDEWEYHIWLYTASDPEDEDSSDTGSTDDSGDTGSTDEDLGACFVAGTLVKTADGNKNIEDVEVGDEVYAFNYLTGEQGTKSVKDTFVREAYDLVEVELDKENISVTLEHPFYVLGYGFKAASELRVGDELSLLDGSSECVESISYTHFDNPIEVYNFEVEDWHTYYVSGTGVLVHNTCMRPINQEGDPFFVGYIGPKDNRTQVIMKNVTMKKETFTVVSKEQQDKVWKDFNNKDRKNFLKKLANEKHDDLIKAGLSEDEIKMMKEEGKVPTGWQVHHKVPRQVGGTNDESNLCLIKNDPYHKAINNYHKEHFWNKPEGYTEEVVWPYPDGSIYPAEP